MIGGATIDRRIQPELGSGELREGDVPRISVIFPAYNERARLPRTLRHAIAYLDKEYPGTEIIVSDDGSTDGTAELVEHEFSRCRLVRAPRNMGKGAAVRRGMLAANGRFRLFSDADLSTPIEELSPMLALIQELDADVVIGSRALRGSRLEVRQPKWREWSGRLFNLLVQPLSGLPFRDTQCGFKLFRDQACEEIFRRLSSPGFAFDVEALMIARRLGFKIQEHPVRWLNDEASKVSMLRDAPRMLRDVLRFRWRQWSGRLVANEEEPGT